MDREQILDMIDPQDSYRDKPAGEDRSIQYVRDNGDYAEVYDGAYHHHQWIVDLETGEAYLMRYNILGDKSWTFPKQWRVSKKLSELGDDKNIYKIHTVQTGISQYREVLGNGNAEYLSVPNDDDRSKYDWETKSFSSEEDIYRRVKNIQKTDGLREDERWIKHTRTVKA